MTLSKVCLRAKDAACRAGSGSAQAPKRVPCGAYDGRVRARADVVRVQADILGRDIRPLARCATVLLKDVAEHYEGSGAGSWKTRTLPISKQAADVSREAFQIGKVAHLATGDRQHGQAVEHKLITSTCIAVDVAELFVVA